MRSKPSTKLFKTPTIKTPTIKTPTLTKAKVQHHKSVPRRTTLNNKPSVTRRSSLSSGRTKNPSTPKPFVPTVISTSAIDMNFGDREKKSFSAAKRTSGRKMVTKTPKPFVPTVMTTSGIDMNFGNSKVKSLSTSKPVFRGKKTPTASMNRSTFNFTSNSLKKDLNITVKGKCFLSYKVNRPTIS